MSMFYDRDGNPITQDEWSALFRPARTADGKRDTYRHVAADTVHDSNNREHYVSTVWLGMDHGYAGPPLIFEDDGVLPPRNGLRVGAAPGQVFDGAAGDRRTPLHRRSPHPPPGSRMSFPQPNGGTVTAAAPDSTTANPDNWNRLERIQYLLDNWDNIFDPNVTSPLGTGSSVKVGALMPKMASHPSVIELARCLRILHQYAPVQHAHLKAYRCGVEYRLVDTTVKVKGANGKLKDVPQRVQERIVPSWVRLEKVRRAEHFLACAFHGDVEIPKDLWDALHLPANSAAWAAYDMKRRRKHLDHPIAA